MHVVRVGMFQHCVMRTVDIYCEDKSAKNMGEDNKHTAIECPVVVVTHRVVRSRRVLGMCRGPVIYGSHQSMCRFMDYSTCFESWIGIVECMSERNVSVVGVSHSLPRELLPVGVRMLSILDYYSPMLERLNVVVYRFQVVVRAERVHKMRVGGSAIQRVFDM